MKEPSYFEFTKLKGIFIPIPIIVIIWIEDKSICLAWLCFAVNIFLKK